MNRSLKWIGKRVPFVDGPQKVSGTAVYGSDVARPGMLAGGILRSPHPHARIVRLDVAKALALPGVCAAVTFQDTPGIMSVVMGPPYEDRYPLAKDKVRFIGEEVAGVAAEDEEVLEEALGRIEVEYEPLPAVFDLESAMAEGAPLVHDKPRNVAAHFLRRYGDVEAGLARADHIFTHRYETQAQAHCCMEPHGTVAEWSADGKLDLWTATQASYWIRQDIAHTLDMPEEKVRIREVFVGGGFGARSKVCDDEVICTLLARKAGRPVRIRLSRGEEFSTTSTRHPMIIQITTGVTEAGDLTARRVRILTDNGAYNNVGPSVTAFAGLIAGAHYRVPAVEVEGYTVYTNRQVGGPFRGYGSPQVTFAIESQMDEIAQALGLDPMEIRLRNANRPGDVTACGWAITSCGMEECIREAGRAIGWHRRKDFGLQPDGTYRGIGMATLVHCSGAKIHRVLGGDLSDTRIEVRPDGRVIASNGNNDPGTGSRTFIAQVVAEELGLRPEEVGVRTMDTEETPLDLGTWASRAAFIVGNSVRRAAVQVRERLLAVAASRLEADVQDLRVGEGRVFVAGAPERGISFGEAAAAACEGRGAVLSVESRYDPPCEFPDKETAYGNLAAAYTFAAHAAEVVVDPGTGRVRVERYVAVHDAGVPLNLLSVEGQIEGAVVQGVGWALSEELRYDHGQLTNPSYLEYMVPRASDVPRVDSRLVDVDDPEGPYGAKGVGEPGMVPVAAAIANAVAHATGHRFRVLPIRAEAVWEAANGVRGPGWSGA